jgi:hypothetical protein
MVVPPFCLKKEMDVIQGSTVNIAPGHGNVNMNLHGYIGVGEAVQQAVFHEIPIPHLVWDCPCWTPGSPGWACAKAADRCVLSIPARRHGGPNGIFKQAACFG